MAAEVKIPIVGDATKYKKALREADGATDNFAKNLGKLAMAAGAAFAVDKIIDFAGAAIGSASDLNESLSKTKVVFGDASGAVIEFAEDAAKNLGLSERAALDAQASFGIFGKSAGLTGDDLSDFTGKLTTLSGDLASFSNTKPEEAAEALGAALRGESEPIRKYGVLLDDATLKARAMKLGIYDGTGALTQQQRVLAAQAEILAQTGDAQGDFARTSDGLANKQRIMAAEFENVKAEVGEKLLPVMVGLVTFVSDTLIPGIEKFVKWTEENWPKVRDAIVPVLEGIRDFIVGFIATVSAIWNTFGATIVQFAKDYFGSVAKVIQGVFEVISGVFQLFKDLLTGKWGELWGDILGIFNGIKDIIVGALAGLWAQISGVAGLAWDALEGTAKKVWAAIAAAILLPISIARDVLSEVWGAITGAASTAFQAIVDALRPVRDAFQWVIDKVELLIGWIAKIKFPSLPGWMTPFGGAGDFVNKNLPPGARASGGPVSAGGTYLVGEQGPELLHMGGNGSVSNAGKTAAMMGGTHIEHVTIAVQSMPSPNEMIAVIKKYEERNGPGWRS